MEFAILQFTAERYRNVRIRRGISGDFVHGAFQPVIVAPCRPASAPTIFALNPGPAPLSSARLELSLPSALGSPMIEATSDDAKINGIGRIGSQPIALAAAALVIIVIGAGSIALWRSYSGTSPEQDRIAAVRQVQARAALASEQLAEKTKALDELPAGVDRPVASCSGSIADAKARFCGPANRCQAADGASWRSLRRDRQPPAVFRERPVSGSIQPALDKT